ncbi:MAG: DUF1501 domain-containing protein [Planctomycetota bacterium]|nr:DUF1501 domain-containing protein [Planctomycetota bacterium]
MSNERLSQIGRRSPCSSFCQPAVPHGRRAFLRRMGLGFGATALSAMLSPEANLASSIDPAQPLAVRPPHHAGQAKSVIWLFMHGAPSHVDTWDYKPELSRRNGQTLVGFDQSTGFFAGAGGPIFKSPFRFHQHGESGTWGSELFPHLSSHVDDMAFMYSCFAHENNHSPAQFQMNTGMARMGFPCVGAWVTYGLGSENQNLPGFMVMYDSRGRGLPKSRAPAWGAGFLPGVYQGTAINSSGPPIAHLASRRRSMSAQRRQLDFVRRHNQTQAARLPGEEVLEARIESFELAYRMQMAAPETLDLSQETLATHRLYGTDEPGCNAFGRQALIARRLVERGVRFVQIYSGGFDNNDCWDGHNNIDANHRQFAGETDQPIAALLTDLKQRGLLETTLVVCCGEFGRLPLVQQGGTGRDHNPHAFTTWMAGGGVRGGARYGATDEIGLKAVEKRVSVHDIHATILHAMGLNHRQLTYRKNGRDFRLTDVAGNVVRDILA